MRMLCALLATAAGLMAQPAAFDSEKLLTEFLERMRETLEHQPDYTCLETVERTRRSTGGNAQVEDTLRLEVALVGSKEMFAWPGSKEFEDKELTDLVSTGMFGNGNFALYPRMLFGSGGPPFVYGGEAEVNGRRTAQYNFRVTRFNSGYGLSVNRQKAYVGYYGSFYVDLESLDLKRLVIIADLIPVELQMTSSEDRVDYDRVPIGEERFLLPVESTLMMAFPDVVNRNRVRFTGCRKFTGESTLLFPEEDVAEAEATPAAALKEVILPRDTQVSLILTSEIVLAEGIVGETVEAKLGSDIKVGKNVLVRKGAIARGRIVKLERQPEAFMLILRFTDLEWPGGHARLNLRFETISGLGLPRRTFFQGPADNEIVIQRGPLKRLKDLQMHWRTAP